MSSNPRLPSHDLGVALREIALPTPPDDGWNRLQAAIAGQAARTPLRSRRRHRRLAGLALVASLGLVAVLVLPSQLTTPTQPSPALELQAAAEPAARGGDALEALIVRSTQLEAQLDWFDGGPRGGDALGVDLALIDRLQWIDQLLSADVGSSDTTEVLWRERIELLSRRLALSQRESLIASVGGTTFAPTL